MTAPKVRLFNNKTIFKWIVGVSFVPPTFYYLYAFIAGELNEPLKEYVVDYFGSAFHSFIISASLFYYNAFVYDGTFRKWSGPGEQRKRLGWAIMLSLIGSNAIALLIMFAFTDWNASSEDIFSNITIVSVITIIVGLLFVGYNFIDLWRNSVVEKEQLEKENIKSRLASLRHQVSPHFLFNSFNALQSLIDSDPDKAKQFIQELSRVYRYSLENGETHMVDLKEELAFINRYIFLQKVRFGDSLEVDIKVDSTHLGLQIPPLSLQLMVENAIKHNVVSSRQPLRITIKSMDDSLEVRNNLQLRTDKQESTGIGLDNLIRRYHLINGSEPGFTQTSHEYIARLPLLKKHEQEPASIDH